MLIYNKNQASNSLINNEANLPAAAAAATAPTLSRKNVLFLKSLGFTVNNDGKYTKRSRTTNVR